MSDLGFTDTMLAIRDSQEMLLKAVRKLSDADVRAPSRLPNWTRGHVLTHLARSADAIHRLVQGIRYSVAAQMYPGGQEARAAAIEEGAGRPLSLLLADLEFSGSRLVSALDELTEAERLAIVAWRRPVTADFLPQLRWRELEIHHLDLGIGFTPAQWSADFVQLCLATELPLLTERAPGVQLPQICDAELLAWMIGRSDDSGLPDLPTWL